ncbi:hypothetical protein E1293_00315 [Actinomadura darangshiensis]|uniref:Uncharacterized protein n=1 Tax=Actinomadura darangshiensis TaxID=705336 RepID=A0A4R5C320_9ACTN|nr:hypothetical protein [Actinomadura darangshiensis]TDD92949.1 hypothetical protein E1293_00315 [Actinomadura darangshiensis]
MDGTPLADPAAVIFGVATEYVGDWLATVMSWLVLSSLFGTAAVAAISRIVILTFRITDRDPVLHMFSWFSALAALAIVLVEPDTGSTGARRGVEHPDRTDRRPRARDVPAHVPHGLAGRNRGRGRRSRDPLMGPVDDRLAPGRAPVHRPRRLLERQSPCRSAD